MKRDLNLLHRETFDLLVIGGGIYGACAAWDAALRGLSVAIIDKGDFGQATSANSLKLIHGGLRYLQDANLRQVRMMARERATWIQIAPHLVHPLPCLVPTYRKLTRSKAALSAALLINDLISYDRNRLAGQQKHLPKGHVLSRAECLARLPGILDEEITGGAYWYDAQIFNTERLLLSIIRSASNAGAVIANYVEATGFLTGDRQVAGVQARDVPSGQVFDIKARVVLNCAGAWTDKVLALSGVPSKPRFFMSTAFNLVTRQILPEHAIGFMSRPRDKTGNRNDHSRLLFMAPWQKYSIIGTIHRPYSGRPEDYQVSEETISEFIEEINRAYPGAELSRKDVYYVHSGFLPLSNPLASNSRVKLLRESRIYDHQAEDGLAGLITVVGVKYTTARKTAQEAIDLSVKKLGWKNLPCKTHKTPVYGGQIEDFHRFLSNAKESLADFSPEIGEHLAYTYGSRYTEILAYVEEDPSLGQRISSTSPVIRAEVVHGVRAEMAQRLPDILFRRTELATACRLDEAGLQACAELMAIELGWDQAAKARALRETRATYQSAGAEILEMAGAI